MAWCLSAESYRAFSLNQILLKHLPEANALTTARRHDLDLLMTESIVNTIDHGAPPPGTAVTPGFGLFISAHDEGLEIAVVQSGDGPADPDGLLGRMHGGVPTLEGESGRGLYLIAEIARFAWFEEEGRCLRFVVARQ
jgi:anti-sigma regulatory factor (Ser/Thr protein kinase)